MSEHVEIDYILTVNTEMASQELMRLERILFRSMSLLRRMGLPEEVDEAIMHIQRLITTIRTMQLALQALQVARMAAGDPLAWLGFIVSAGAAAMTVGDTVYDATRGR